MEYVFIERVLSKKQKILATHLVVYKTKKIERKIGSGTT